MEALSGTLAFSPFISVQSPGLSGARYVSPGRIIEIETLFEIESAHLVLGL